MLFSLSHIYVFLILLSLVFVDDDDSKHSRQNVFSLNFVSYFYYLVLVLCFKSVYIEYYSQYSPDKTIIL